MSIATYKGLGQFDGWRFTLEPQVNHCGSAGFVRRQLSPSKMNMLQLSGVQHQHNEFHNPDWAAKVRKGVEDPEPEWIEAAWLENWLKRGLITEESP